VAPPLPPPGREGGRKEGRKGEREKGRKGERESDGEGRVGRSLFLSFAGTWTRRRSSARRTWSIYIYIYSGLYIYIYIIHNIHSSLSRRYVDKETLFREADVISLHVPLLPSTYHIINKCVYSSIYIYIYIERERERERERDRYSTIYVYMRYVRCFGVMALTRTRASECIHTIIPYIDR
jgi:hypothetical protein